MLKTAFYFFLCLFLTCVFSAKAQDKIILLDGSSVQAKVREVSPRQVIYRRWDNQDGPEYVVNRRDVDRIVYQNGTEEVITRSRFSREPRRPAVPHASEGDNREVLQRTSVSGYGKNILSIAPIQMTNESAAGLGIHYERMLDKNNIIALYIPVALSFFEDEVSNNGWSSMYYPKKSRTMAYIYPGAKFYPAGSAHRVSYSVGPSFGLGFGTKYKEKRTIDPGTGSVIYTYDEGSVFKAGFLVTNGLNIQPTKALYVGLELGVGIFYYNNETSDFAAGDAPMVQFNFKMGYRF